MGLAKTAGDISNKLHDVYKNVKDREIKQQVAGLLDQMQELKRSAYALEDENRDLREKLRFKSEDFEFRHPFYYESAHPDQPLCPKCFHEDKASPMGEDGQGAVSGHRRCLVCGHDVEVGHRQLRSRGPGPSSRGGGGPHSWMAR